MMVAKAPRMMQAADRRDGITVFFQRLQRPLKSGESLKKRVHSDFKAVKKDKALIQSFFKCKSVDYTAA